jgi:hypothetical protein
VTVSPLTEQVSPRLTGLNHVLCNWIFLAPAGRTIISPSFLPVLHRNISYE